MGKLFSWINARRLRQRLLWGGLLFLGIWIMFFDTHNVWDHLQKRQVESELMVRNDSLRAGIEQLQQDLQATATEEVVEKVAREEYGMRRPGETVHRVEEQGEAEK